MIIKYSSEDIMLPAADTQEASLPSAAVSGNSLLHDFELAIGFLILLSAIVKFTIHLFVPGA